MRGTGGSAMTNIYKAVYQDKALNKREIEIKEEHYIDAVIEAFKAAKSNEHLVSVEWVREVEDGRN